MSSLMQLFSNEYTHFLHLLAGYYAVCRRLLDHVGAKTFQAYVAAKRIEGLFFLEESHLPAVKGIASFLPEAGSTP